MARVVAIFNGNPCISIHVGCFTPIGGQRYSTQLHPHSPFPSTLYANRCDSWAFLFPVVKQPIDGQP